MMNGNQIEVYDIKMLYSYIEYIIECSLILMMNFSTIIGTDKFCRISFFLFRDHFDNLLEQLTEIDNNQIV